MYRSILRYFITVMLISLGISMFLNEILISNTLLENTEKEMGYSVKLIAHSINYKDNLSSQVEELAPFAYSENTRISIIDKKGNVLADTYKKFQSTNHLHRKEVQEALKHPSQIGYAIRESETTNESMLYAAFLSGDYIVRLSMPYNGVTEYLSTLAPAIVMSTLFSFIISYILSRRLAKRVTRPLNELVEALDTMTDDFRFELDEYDYEEVDTITETLENLTHRLRKSMRETAFERNKQDEIIRQMREGFILLDEKNTVLSINKAARKILGDLEVKDRFASKVKNEELLAALESSEKHERVEMSIDHLYYRCYISKLPFGKALFLVDITAIHNGAKMREEFFSSVSHELKTPITSIRGYTELLSAGLIVEEEKKKEVFTKILDQVRNMNNLINDILMLSRLDTKDIVVENVPLRIKSVIDNVLEDHEAAIISKNINVVKDVDDIIFNGNESQIETLVSNLVSNAIKYNKDSGVLRIEAKENKESITLIVEDTGIGIPASDKERVFERFYRVDKGRSRALGGTGLGLAIVKHIVSYYGGSIKMTSELGAGTKIMITLPNQKEL